MKVIFLGCTKFSEALLQTVYSHENIELKAIFTIPKSFTISYSDNPVENTNYANLKKWASKWEIKHFEVDSVDGKRLKDYKRVISEIEPDVILVIGWYYMVPKEIRELATYGAWGIHASLLPKYAGGAPLVWAIIEGAKKTGVTLFKLSEGVDDGDIIAQKAFPIKSDETIKEVYENATVYSKEILNKVFNNPENLSFKKQDKDKIEVYPQRKPEDGEIDLSWSADKIFNFIRAQSDPYPGAFIKNSEGKKLILKKIRIE